jgi:hypothetical protein
MDFQSPPVLAKSFIQDFVTASNGGLNDEHAVSGFPPREVLPNWVAESVSWRFDCPRLWDLPFTKRFSQRKEVMTCLQHHLVT